MDRKKSQAFNFANEVIPIMFHSQTTDFFAYLERDGLKFLEFWWNYVGEQLPEEQHRPMEGMGYKLVKIDEKNSMILITLPEPQSAGEVYFLAMLRKPERHFGWVRLPSTRVLAMIKRPTVENPDETELGDLTPRGHYVPIRRGPTPTLGNMTKIAFDLTNQKQA
jgi:hypothetical protein